MKKKCVVSILVIIEIISIIIIFGKDNNDTISLINKKEETNNMFAIMVSDDGTNWTEHDGTGFPEGKKFQKAECYDANDNEIHNAIEFNEEDNKVTATLNSTAYCYLYFMKEFIEENTAPIFAVYSAPKSSLRFYQNYDYDNGLVIEKQLYDNYEVTKVYPNLNDTNYKVAYITKNIGKEFIDVLDEENSNLPPWYELGSQMNGGIKTIEVVEEIFPKNTAYWFADMIWVLNYKLDKLNTSKVIDMTSMFNNEHFKVVGDTWWIEGINCDRGDGCDNEKDYIQDITITGLEKWNVSNVTKMTKMFYWFGAAHNINSDVIDLSNWNTRSVENMSWMFSNIGYSSSNFNFGDLSNWNTSKVTDMSNMFKRAAYKSRKLNIGNINTKNVEKNGVNYKAWDVSNVNNMWYMFSEMGNYNRSFQLDLSNWDVSNVEIMTGMFHNAGNLNYSTIYSGTIWDVGDISNWNTSKVTDMSSMFKKTGYSVETFKMSDISKWDTSNVTCMSNMFNECAYNTNIININNSDKSSLNLTSWAVNNVDCCHIDFSKDTFLIESTPKWIQNEEECKEYIQDWEEDDEWTGDEYIDDTGTTDECPGCEPEVY